MKIPCMLIWLSLSLLGAFITCVATAFMWPFLLLGWIGGWIIELGERFE
jgi:hypothetical protein